MSAKKLLIIHQGALGDFVLTFPAIIGLKRTYRPIDVLCQRKLGKVARNDPGGFGVQFTDAPERLATMIEALP